MHLPLYLSYLKLFLRLKYYYLSIGGQRGSFEEGQRLPSLKARSPLSLGDKSTS
jgi:hypothetical protein